MWKTILTTPVGELHGFASETGLRALLWPESDTCRFEEGNQAITSKKHPTLAMLSKQLNEYFDGGRQQFDLPLDPVGTEFQLSAWEALRNIPFGETRTYAEQATNIGCPKAARAVGAANGKNPISIVVPCHRVIGKNGNLTGFAGGIEVKQFLLELESKFVLQDN